MDLSRLTLGQEDRICIVSSYSVILLVTWSPYCVNELKYSLLSFILARIASAMEFPKLFQHNSCMPT